MSTTTVSEYLLDRLAQMGVESVFGVPGDFSLQLAEKIIDHKTLDWIGTCNELNAAYAADGYSRVKGVPGCLSTTFGVGELSAINGIAGSFAERVPVIHIVGTPTTRQMKAKPLLHHTLGNGHFEAYSKAAQHFVVASATLSEPSTAGAEIDRVLVDCVTKSRPVYITLPTDLVNAIVPAVPLQTPLDFKDPENDTATEAVVLAEIEKQVSIAQERVVVIVDGCALRHGVANEVKDLLEKTKFPVFAAPMGKSSVDESYERFVGIYNGSPSLPAVKQTIERAALIISIGAIYSDINTGGFSHDLPKTKLIELHTDRTEVFHALYPRVGMKRLLPKLTAKLQTPACTMSIAPYTYPIPQEEHDGITQPWLWPTVGSYFEPGDVIVADTGTSAFGTLDIPLKTGSVYITQTLWGSIGYSVGAALGAALAARQCQMGRTYLFVGDGSLQLTVQELSTIMHLDLKPIIFVLNNSGYTIERFLHGPTRSFNDIVNWKWTKLLDALSDENTVSESYKVTTKTELDRLLSKPQFGEVTTLVEVVVPKFDAPPVLRRYLQ
ncbi:pyruvate decarboxylase [Thelephora terrestris]|uniref:Pyruvate decarboxylase n=1 Tax=Thelephora terrestris TaxID=56493 RepID=A0A9P6HM12_9AGAM|nr:pyruvate decarboxylase [Thelephora terrestris]